MSRGTSPSGSSRSSRGSACGITYHPMRQFAIAGVVAVLAVVAFIMISGGGSQPAPSTTVPPGVRQASHVRGLDTALVTIEEWADFQCPACGTFARTTEPQLVATYVARARHFAFLGSESQWAAEASECADDVTAQDGPHKA